MPRIAIFGSFDGLHPGHEHVLEEAAGHGEVVVILAQDGVIRRLKHREPHVPFATRREALQAHPRVARVVPSDSEEGGYHVLTAERPDIVGFGYDQHALRENFLAWQQKTGFAVPVITFTAYEPEKYKTSVLKPISGLGGKRTRHPPA